MEKTGLGIGSEFSWVCIFRRGPDFLLSYMNFSLWLTSFSLMCVLCRKVLHKAFLQDVWLQVHSRQATLWDPGVLDTNTARGLLSLWLSSPPARAVIVLAYFKPNSKVDLTAPLPAVTISLDGIILFQVFSIFSCSNISLLFEIYFSWHLCLISSLRTEAKRCL